MNEEVDVSTKYNEKDNITLIPKKGNVWDAFEAQGIDESSQNAGNNLGIVPKMYRPNDMKDYGNASKILQFWVWLKSIQIS